MNAIKGFLGFESNSGPQVGSPVPPPAAINAAPASASASAPTPLKNLNKEKVAALKPAGVSMPNASAATAAAEGGDFSDYIGGARRRKNLRKKYKMPGRRSTRRANRKTAATRKGRKATRKNRRASRKNRK